MDRRWGRGAADGTGLDAAIDRALAGDGKGDDKPLFTLLARASGLPGVRVNVAMAQQFAKAAAARGSLADPLIGRMAALHPDVAPGASEWEFLPVCGVTAAGQRGASDEAVRVRMLRLLHEAADDLRFRVRDAVPDALARIGERTNDGLLAFLSDWADGYFHSAAVLLALARPGWLTTIRDPAPVLAFVDRAFALARDADRSTSRYPGHKALMEALGTVPATLAARFGVPVFDLLEGWAKGQDPTMREVVAANLEGTRLSGRYAPEVARVRRALDSSAPVRRDPTTDVGPTRGRGRKRSR
jgi:hypothetical protein